jgi:hypothetical protein
MNEFEMEETWLGDFFTELPMGFDLGMPEYIFAGQPIIGDTAATSWDDWIPQTTDYTCAVVSQQMILEQFGFNTTEQELMFIGFENGWLTEGGTSLSDMGKLLEYHGIGTHEGVGGGVDSLINELRHGRKVIVGLDSGELWNQDSIWQDLIGPDGADHAVVVTGLDFRDSQNPLVYINDPGDPDGAARPYPLDKFADAWNDSNCHYVATDMAPEDLASNPIFGANFLTGPDGIGQYMNSEWWGDWFSQNGAKMGQACGAMGLLLASKRNIGSLKKNEKQELLKSI